MIASVFEEHSYAWSPYALPTLLTALVMLYLGASVLRGDRMSRAGMFFFVFTFFCFVWLSAFTLMYAALDPRAALFWAKAAYLGVPFIPVAVYHFAAVQTGVERRRRGVLRALWLGAAAFSAAALLGEQWVAEVRRYFWGSYPLYRWLGVPFLLFFFTALGAALHELWRDYRQAPAESDRLRSRSFLIAFGVASIASVDFLPTYGIEVYPIGYLFVLAFVAIVTAAIRRHRLAAYASMESEEKFHALAESANDAILSADSRGNITYANAAAVLIFGYTADELASRPLTLLMPERFHEAHRRGMQRFLAGGESRVIGRTVELAGQRKSGEEFPLELSLSTWKTEQATFFTGVLRDITERHRAQLSLHKSEEKFRALTETSAAAVFIYQDDRIRYANAAASTITGHRAAELLGMRYWDLVHPDYRDVARERGAARQRGAAATPRYEMKLLTKGGEERWVDVTATSIDFEGRRAGVDTAFDVTERKLAENAMRESERHMQEILANVQMVSVLLDVHGDITFCNPYLLELTGREEEEAIGCNWFGLFVPPEQREGLLRNFLEQVRAGTIAPHDESRILTRQGEERLISWNNTVLRDLDGRLMGVALIGADVTERRRAEEQLVHDAFHDSLTGLPNRALFMDRLHGSVARQRRRPGALFAVLFIDLDRFKLVNDSLGHVIGDQLLSEISRVFQEAVRPGDTVARLGGDEFAILLDDIEDTSDATRVAERIQRSLASPFNLGGREVFVSVSIGISLSASGYDRTEDLLRDADTAMYQAKAGGKARHQIFDVSMHARAVRLLELENSLRRAVDRSEFMLHYQPIVDLVSGQTRGFEALIRWSHPERGLVSPLEFVPLAEETGLILAIGHWALREACRQMRAWQEQFGLQLSMNVNLSSRQFSQSNLSEQILEVLQETGLQPESLKLEITESVIMENAESAVAMLKRLKDVGVRLCIDDFGTGYSSLSYLLRFPADTLKIDRAFMWALGDAGPNTQIVRAVISLAKALNMDVVAEGVETEDQRAQLIALGCPHAQGFLFSRPLDPEKAAELLAEASRRRPLAKL